VCLYVCFDLKNKASNDQVKGLVYDEYNTKLIASIKSIKKERETVNFVQENCVEIFMQICF
jgi:hypothetical protein